MPILIALGLVLLLLVVLGPQLWVRSAMRRHAADRPDLPGTGGELARHLLDLAGLRDVPVETVPAGDHYDPVAKAVRLTPATFEGRSITAVAVATHEVSHALQDADGNRFLAARVRLAGVLRGVEVVRSPALLMAEIAFVVLLMASRLLVHVVTLPLELDASFRRALPILERGQFLESADLPAARTVLRAAALTYVAGALVTLFDITRLLRVLRF
jgi:Zn-dependent membrane protease YugP